MPNHVTNYITFKGDTKEIRRMLEAVKPDDGEIGHIDFMKIKPRPAELDIEAGSVTYRGMKEYQKLMDKLDLPALAITPKQEGEYLIKNPDIDENEWEQGKQACKNLETYGAQSWYEWNIQNWGTKWNAYSNYGTEEYMLFDTAWSAPEEVLDELSARYPGIVFDHKYADEDVGNNCGEIIYAAGSHKFVPIAPDGSDEKIRFACEILGIDADEYLEEYKMWREEWGY